MFARLSARLSARLAAVGVGTVGTVGTASTVGSGTFFQSTER